MVDVTRLWLPLVAATALVFGPGAASAQTSGYPTKPIRFLVGVAPGGGTDFVAQLIGARLSDKFGQPVITDNRTGATGNIALELTAKAAPDGYTFAVVQSDIWQGVLAPAKTPNAIIEKMSRAIAEAVTEPEVVQKLAVQGGGPAGTTPKVFAQFLKDESSRWLALAREVNITAD